MSAGYLGGDKDPITDALDSLAYYVFSVIAFSSINKVGTKLGPLAKRLYPTAIIPCSKPDLWYQGASVAQWFQFHAKMPLSSLSFSTINLGCKYKSLQKMIEHK